MLSEDEAREIFSLRPEYALDKNGRYTFLSGSSESATIVGQRYNVGSRTVRDIWNRKAWISATRPDWTPEEVAGSDESTEADNAGVIPVQIRKRGRPCSAKDAFPRVQRRGKESPSESSLSGDGATRPTDLDDKNHAANLSSNDPTSLRPFCDRPSLDLSDWSGHQQLSAISDPSSALENTCTVMQQAVTITHLKTQAPTLAAPASGSQQSPHNLVQQWLDLASRTLVSQNAAVPSQQNALLLNSHNADRKSAFCQSLPRQSDTTHFECGPTTLSPPLAQTSGSQALSAALSLLSPQHLATNQPRVFPTRALAPQPQDAFLCNHGPLPAQLELFSASTRMQPGTGAQPTTSLPPAASSSTFALAPPRSSSVDPSPGASLSSPLGATAYLWRPGLGTLGVPEMLLKPQQQVTSAPTKMRGCTSSFSSERHERVH